MTTRRRGSGLAAIGVVLAVVLGVWLADGGDPGSSEGRSGPAARPSVTFSGRSDPTSGLPVVDLGRLPVEATTTVREIEGGGPYPYEEDGTIFGNYEHLLPAEPHGYYTEFTVVTPGSSDRGARRIIHGEDGELYWTDDHYLSFARIQQ